MPLQLPNLDDRTFLDIVAEARALIPRYAPEWTDFNDSDPGMTLVQLFAWMTEMTIYRLNRVPDRLYLKFLQLLGFQLVPALPARAELTFRLDRKRMAELGVNTTIVPKGTQVAASGGGDEPPPVFETERGLNAIEAELKVIQTFDGFSYSPETEKNEALGQSFFPFGRNIRDDNSLLLGFDSPLPFPSVEFDLAFYLFRQDDARASFGKQPVQACIQDLERLPAPADTVWEFCNGQSWEALSLIRDDTRAFTRDGHISFQGPGGRAQKALMGIEKKEKLYWIRCRLVRSAYERPPRLDQVLTNTVAAVQTLTVEDEVLGGSDGSPNQRFTLEHKPVVANEVRDKDGSIIYQSTLVLQVEERPRLQPGPGLEVQPVFDTWQEVTDFFASTPDSPHYTLDRNTGEIRFGDGEHGRIPVANPDNPGANIVARIYQYGGGKAGNIPAGKIIEVQTAVDFVESVSNQRAAYGGADEERLEEAQLRARQSLKTHERAVTSEDFETLAMETPGARVRRAKAMPLVHPRFPGASVPGVVTVVVIPDSEDPRPMPSQETIGLVCAYLSKRRLLTTEVYVVPPTYHKVTIEVNLIARPQADLGEVKKEVNDRLLAYFHPFLGGEDGTGWEFGADIVYSDIFRQILDFDDVDRIYDKLVIYLDDERQPDSADVRLRPGELLYSEGHRIQVSYRERG